MAGISISRSALLNTLTYEERESMQHICKNAHVYALAQPGLDALRNFMRDIFQTLQTNPSLIKNKHITSAIRSTLVALLSDNLIHTAEVPATKLSTSRCWKIVAESRELVLGQSEKPVTVAELCQHFDISRRTLQYCFHDLLGTSPAIYLRTERLNAVRHMLKKSDSVTEAAAYWGFWHFGHFSQEYKKMFGELPSTTFKRLHALN